MYFFCNIICKCVKLLLKAKDGVFFSIQLFAKTWSIFYVFTFISSMVWIALQYFSIQFTHSVSHFFFFLSELLSFYKLAVDQCYKLICWLFSSSWQHVHIFNHLETGFKNNLVQFAEIELYSSVVESFSTDPFICILLFSIVVSSISSARQKLQ